MKTSQEVMEAMIEANNRMVQVHGENVWTSQEIKSNIGVVISQMDTHKAKSES
jgi:iron-sulfur cluster repair protein YtfE (RIC family)